MEVNNLDIKDGDAARSIDLLEAPSTEIVPKLPTEGNIKKKRRRGKTKRKVLKPYPKIPWQERRVNEKSKRNNRFRNIVVSKTQAPFNNNQFLMEIHKPEPENNFQLFRTPSARTRESSFSVDSEENYFYSLPDDEEEYLTKEFSSVYEDAQSERLSNMSKTELIQEYLLLEAKYENLVKRTERTRVKEADENLMFTDKTTPDIYIDKENMLTDKDTCITTVTPVSIDEPFNNIMQQLKEQEELIQELKAKNETLLHENNHLRQRGQGSSEDSESDSSSSSDSCSSSSSNRSPIHTNGVANGNGLVHDESIDANDEHNSSNNCDISPTLVNGFHSPSD